MAAQERLVVIFAGSDPRTGAEIPPAVPIGELLDALDTTARTEDGAPVRSKLTTRHPLQPFDVANFAPGGLGARAGFSFDRAGSARRTRRRPGASCSCASLRQRAFAGSQDRRPGQPERPSPLLQPSDSSTDL